MFSFISLRTQYENLGDEVINGYLVKKLSSMMPVYALTDGVPEWYIANFKSYIENNTNKVHLVKSKYEFYRKLLFLSLFGSKSYLFLSPGGSKVSKNIVSRRDRILTAMTYLPYLRIATVGTSYESMPSGRALILRNASRRSDFLSVRDVTSQEMALAAGISLPIVPDLAFLMGREHTEHQRNCVLISLRKVPISEDFMLSRIEKIVEYYKGIGVEPIFSWQVTADRAYCSELSQTFNSKFYDFSSERPTLAEVKELYQRCSAVFSNRLHVLLVAAAFGSVPFPVLQSEEKKVRGVFKSGGIDDLIISEFTDLEDIPNHLDNLEQLSRRVDATFGDSIKLLDRFFRKFN